MSTKEDEVDEVCASCGNKGGNGINLKRCNACKLARYCSVACQKENRSQHKRECKRRAAELRDELLFEQPESSHLGDCPICFLPLPYESKLAKGHACCAKLVCGGCCYANTLREQEESVYPTCPFCRTPWPKTDEELNQYLEKRFEANDPIAIYDMGMQNYQEQNYSSAFELYTKAAKLGDVESHYQLARLYRNGQGVARDEKREMHHLEEGSILGHPGARFNIGSVEITRGRMDRAVKHFIIGANLGHDDSMEQLKKMFRGGLVKKEDLAAALRAHKDAVDATKSPQRQTAELFNSAYGRLYNEMHRQS